MAFSYSDKNFTVVGNLCFVHIYTNTAGAKKIKIPPAIVNRMFISNFYVSYDSYASDGSAGQYFALISDGEISFTQDYDEARVNFFFPIDSNK